MVKVDERLTIHTQDNKLLNDKYQKNFGTDHFLHRKVTTRGRFSSYSVPHIKGYPLIDLSI